MDICVYSADNIGIDFDNDTSSDDHIVMVKYTIPSSPSVHDSKANFSTNNASMRQLQQQQQSILLISEDSEEADSLLTGLQILATSCRGKFMRKLARMSRIFDLYWTRKAFKQLVLYKNNLRHK